MKIAFLGLGRMGRELVRHLLAEGTYEVTVWNRTPAAAQPFAQQGARVASSVAEAVAGAEVVLTCLFGPDAVRQVMMDSGLALAQNTLWIDISTVGPQMAGECERWAVGQRIGYVHAPVLGSLGPAKARDLGVLIGGSATSRDRARPIVSLWADPERIVEFDHAAKAATGKLVVNYGLAVGMQALVEAVRVGQAGGLTQDEALGLVRLPKTPLSVIAGMKGANLQSRDYSDSQFSTNALAKDADLMLSLADGQAVPALMAAFASLEHARRQGHGEDDFSSMAG